MATLAQMFERTRTVALQAAQEAISNYTTWLHEQLMQLYKDLIQEWYDEYTPAYYKRKFSLFNLLSIQRYIDNSFDMMLSSQNITPTRQGDQDYIYEITIRQGWHGGALHQGNMRYRNSAKWGKTAVKHFAPLAEFQRRIDTTLNITYLGNILSAFLAQSYQKYGLQ